MLRLGRDEGGPVRNQQSKSQGLSQEHLLGPSLHSPPALRLSSVAVLVFSTPDWILYPPWLFIISKYLFYCAQFCLIFKTALRKANQAQGKKNKDTGRVPTSTGGPGVV